MPCSYKLSFVGLTKSFLTPIQQFTMYRCSFDILIIRLFIMILIAIDAGKDFNKKTV